MKTTLRVIAFIVTSPIWIMMGATRISMRYSAVSYIAVWNFVGLRLYGRMGVDVGTELEDPTGEPGVCSYKATYAKDENGDMRITSLWVNPRLFSRDRRRILEAQIRGALKKPVRKMDTTPSLEDR